MILILKKLPVGLTGREFKTIVDYVVDGAFESSIHLVRKTEIMVLFDRVQGKFEFYGLIHCCDRSVGEAVGELFDGFFLRGHILEASKFFHRKPMPAASLSVVTQRINANRRRTLGEQVLMFNTIEEIELTPLLEPSRQCSEAQA